MKNHILCTAKKYQGHHIAYESFNSRKIVAFGDDPVIVINKAKKQGFLDPVLSYVPEANRTFVY